MTTIKKLLVCGMFCTLMAVAAQSGFAQDNGVIQALGPDNGGLPPGAVYENGIVSHPLTSAEENLHLLAGYYYSNPREWKRIYNDNRNVIRNPNRLPVGQTLKIHVGENWKPLFSYEEWFRLANRNGQWKPGQPWRPARSSSGTIPATAPAPIEKSSLTQTAPTPTPEPKPEIKAPQEETSPPAQAQPAAPEETTTEQAPPPPEETPEPEEAEEEEEAAPAF